MWGYCGPVHPDPEIERLEADLRRSRLERWEVETLLADRHRAKIEALERPKNRLAYRWRVFREITDPFMIYVGWAFTYGLFVVWLLTGSPLGFLH